MTSFRVNLLAVVISVLFALALAQTQPSYDHQNTTYTSPFKPVSASSRVSITPIFSPDHSIDTLVGLITSAKSSVDIGTPSFSSWAGCSFGDSCIGCSVDFMRNNESFPIWRALVNAVHKGLHVRILTNNYGDADCKGKISPLSYLALAGAQIRFYTSTTFIHAKYVAVDGQKAAISSINYSKTSIMKNREAGMIISDDSSGTLVGFTNAVFDYDFSHGTPYKVTQQYPPSEMAIIADKTMLDLMMPNQFNFSCDVKSPEPKPITAAMNTLLYASPDYAYDSLVATLKSAKASVWISIYQITGYMCDLVVELAQRGIQVRLFVSNDIYSTDDYKAAQKCYANLYQNSVTIRKSKARCLTYSHQKYWIIDGRIVVMSTGNWSPTDYPQAPYIFRPFGSPDWRKVNRDFTLQVENNDVVERFSQVFETDYAQGYNYYPQ